MWKKSERSVAAMGTMVVEGGNEPKRLKFQEMVEDREEDRISTLPDCLLIEILSRLRSTKSAIRTGKLSTRWKPVWISVPSLYFNDEMCPRLDFCSNVEKTLAQCRQSKLEKFVVHTSYDTRFQSQVNNWIRYAVRCNVEQLDLALWSPILIAEFVLDQFFFDSSYFTDLKLQGCIFNPVGAISWKNLKSLSISDGNLDENLIENMLSGSPLLETLALTDCYGYRRLNITSKSVKNLEFHGYYCPRDDNDIIEINAPNILSLTIKGELVVWKLLSLTIKGELVVWKFLMVNVASLVEATLDYSNNDPIEPMKVNEEMLKEYILNLRHVKELKIGVRFTKVLFRLEAKGFSFPSNIKFPAAYYDWSEYDSDSSDADSISDSIESDMVSDISNSDNDDDSDSVESEDA